MMDLRPLIAAFLLFSTSAFAQEPSECRGNPVHVGHTEFPQSQLQCFQLDPRKVHATAHVLVGVGLSGQFLIVEHWETLILGRRTGFVPGRVKLKKAAKNWTRNVFKFEIQEWAPDHDSVEGQRIWGYLSKDNDGDAFTCFISDAYKGHAIGGSYKRMLRVTYCERGDSHLGLDKTTEITKSIRW